MGRASRDKGQVGEREVVKLCEAAGFTGLRTRSGGGQVRGDIAGLPGVALEVKRVERGNVSEWMRQAEANCGDDTPVVAHRKSREPWLCTLPMDDYLELLARGQS